MNVFELENPTEIFFMGSRDTFIWTCDKCGKKSERPYTSVSDIKCEHCEGGMYRLMRGQKREY